MNDTHQIEQIELARLVAHPRNANVMPAAVMKKLRRHIERTGRYEPLVVRPHPTAADCFELINGHHRKEVLESLGHTEASCVVWNLTDAETLLLLATVNRLSGEDSPTKRLALLEQLSAEMEASAADLALLLPEEEATLRNVLSRDDMQPMQSPPRVEGMPEALTLFMTAEAKRNVVAVLKRTHKDAATALCMWAAEKEKFVDPACEVVPTL